ncbi:nitrate reductase [Pseudoneurospora amorphoporcata]|uniref:Nitrate reductase n=1 Tax=Pseudoneurospora amorphoporcata TaxID=241081 RepID=A0AAN6NTT2_9PEZI|nr:nitrate reductase [Pseudoneurospora amorphoporcata]
MEKGRCHQETTNEFVSIHDDFAWKKLHECILGRVTDKTANFIRESAEAAAKEEAEQSQHQKHLALQRRRWIPVKLVNRRQVSPDTNTYTFQLPEGKTVLGLGTCQHLQIGFHLRDKMLIRQYTPTRPLLPAHDSQSRTFDLTVKTYFPSSSQPGGALSNILDCLPLGSEVEVRGPTGDINYQGNGHFSIEGRDRHFSRVSLVLGGSGITPGYALMARILIIPGDRTEISVIDANRIEQDILLKKELDNLEEKSGGQLKICHRCLFKPACNNVALLCGPPGLIQGVVLPALVDWGYIEDQNLFGF